MEGSVIEQAEDHFLSYATNHCDDNNWWHIEGAVTNDDRTHGAIQFAQVGSAWYLVWDLAARAVASEFRADVDPEFTLGDRSHKQIIEWLNCKLPPFLARCYQDAAGTNPQNGFDMDRYLCAQMSRAYELYQHVHGCDRAPFTSHVTEPYDYRAFDLTSGEQANAIVLVDIHT